MAPDRQSLTELHRSTDDATGANIASGKVATADGSGNVVWGDAAASGLGWFVVTDYGAVGDGTTDDASAIQDTIDAAAAAGGGVIYFPAGRYLISNALQDTGARNAQLLLPTVSTSDPQITLWFKGPLHPPFTVHGDLPDPGGFAIIESDLTGASGTAAVISGGSGTWPTQNNVCVVVENLICISPPNPSMTWWNIQTCQGGWRRGLYITTTDWDLTPTTEPTNTNAYGIKLPQWGQSNGSQDEIMVGGHYTGILQGELSYLTPIIGQCAVGIELGESMHPSWIRGHITGCTYMIRVTGYHVCDIWIDLEHYTNPPFDPPDDWLVTIYDLDDPDDGMVGHVRWFGLDGVAQEADHSFIVNGGANTTNQEIGKTPVYLTRWEAVTDGEDVFVWDGDDLVHEFKEY